MSIEQGNLLNDSNDLSLADNTAGGKKNTCDIYQQTSQSIEHPLLPPSGDLMEALRQKLECSKRTDVPLFLDHNNWTFLDLALHAKFRQYLDESTIEKHLRYLGFMERHPCPVDLRHPTPENFLRHVDYRLVIDDPPATPNALKHEKQALLMLLRATKQFTDDWKEYIKIPPAHTDDGNDFIPLPKVVNQLFHAQYSEDTYENILLQTIVFVGFNFGMRPPSEMCNLNLEDVVIYEDGSGYIRIHEDKKHGRTRIYYPWDKVVLSSKVYRTPKNYLDTWRRKAVSLDSGNALFLQPNGRRITEGYLESNISPVFKAITKERNAKLYTMRKTFATYLYDQERDIHLVAKRLGHKNLDNVMKYVHLSEDLRRQSKGDKRRNLFHQALRQPQFLCWLGESMVKETLA
ncbi:MAG: site-specific integrase [Euryarchaeota archaeon]|nr:site-specific integrase [Euryarchaeota archaeon]